MENNIQPEELLRLAEEQIRLQKTHTDIQRSKKNLIKTRKRFQKLRAKLRDLGQLEKQVKESFAEVAGTIAVKQWIRQITAALAEYDHVEPNSLKLYQFSDENKFLLLNWKAWSLRYAIDVNFILKTLLDYYHKVRRMDTGYFGVPVRNLTGQRAQEILEKQIAATYPNGECFAVRNSEIRSALLNHHLRKFTKVAFNWNADLENYRERLQKTHELNAYLPAKFIRAWRTNPFHKDVRG